MELFASKRPNIGKGETKMSKHECKRFKTAMKRGGVRYTVACRECGKKRMVQPMHDIKASAGKLP